ncbi:helicase SKI2W-like isoform X1 [Homarus americanus]|uniref:Helicase SKI2W-like n=1 Tax=Homarus americanus TaxID=6706 RepID=A0A8J5KAB3_HOMAM|nr:helicase SKI2W-like isoform X1 [Homarus americanus]XP_042220539.1 helicase SKI2W-like isoform X1 [Homarus americanus]KAG7169871.1 Helicase SKI2W-like [Homarus americanus]
MDCLERLLGKLPPVLPSLKDQIEEYLLTPEELPIHDPIFSRRWFPRKPDPTRLYDISLLPPSTCLEVERDPATGEITGLREVPNKDAGATAKNSLSMRRAPGPPEETVRGSSTNFPFWPGGFPEPVLDKESVEAEFQLDSNNYLSHHPKLSRGMIFEVPKQLPEKEEKPTEKAPELVVSITDMLQVDESVLKIFDEKEEKVVKKELILTFENLNEEDTSLVKNFNIEPPPKKDEFVLNISDASRSSTIVVKNTEWAENIDVNEPVDDFNSQVPNPACKYPFELDTFQKQAILHLEKHDCVFVAAHTSAGKTVVAEYAIALTLKHMTRAAYTSPIKALSNQKYRDFKVKFDDVGLLTGDIQINPKASCLIMTTEILQSMLYNGSDLIRDLEWVIFDEVHYINNAERGHVWEEVLIMLPSTVNIVLLSATVPNTIEFADWIGRIKKRKIYVISTSKRPVPLEHFLYTGTGGKSKDERFLLVDANGRFINKGYNDAVAAKNEKKKGHTLQGPKQGRQHMGEKQEKNMWIGLIDHLSKRDLLPIVAFTLSKKRCDSNATQLMSQDLTTKREKGEIFSFIKKCTDRLQGTDKELPQVIYMRSLLQKGIGIHHSGILPILKEVVEMLFAKGLVKLLFATETFAMGVNMPARCVIFDSIRKHDGKAFRDLVPSEYIQMAGRAGRRGLDSTGTVIILCKNEVPELSELHHMMLGKPTKLESQFKLTYSMILNILRVESISVEDMMKRSFSEVLKMANESKYEAELKQAEERLGKEPEFECMMCKDIEKYYACAKEYERQRRYVYENVLGFPGVMKTMTPGRIVIICFNQYQFRLACLLKIDVKDRNKLTVLILKDGKESSSLTKEQLRLKEAVAASQVDFDILENTSEHASLEMTPQHLAAITNKVIKVNGEKVIDNIKKRQIPRFRDDPPSPSVMGVINELQRLNESGGENLSYLDLVNDCGVRDLAAVTEIDILKNLKLRVMEQSCLECTQFREHFGITFVKLSLQEEIGRLKFLMSEEALQLHPEYQMRIQVLKKLGYIENNNTVTLKGRVACEMGNHELMVTELVLENVFADSPVEIIAALLSSMVFQQKHCSDPNLTPELQKGIKQFQSVASHIGEVQKACGLPEAVGDFVEQFNFGLTEVVYEWAHGMPFNKIMELTDVQEGITVKCIQRLDETFKDVKNAAHLIGDPNLREKMEAASTAIKRDIVFTPSLYTQ